MEIGSPIKADRTRPWGEFEVYLENENISRKEFYEFVKSTFNKHGVSDFSFGKILYPIYFKVGQWPVTVKLIFVKAGSRLSLQRHKKRDEYWKVIYGDVRVIKDDDSYAGTVGSEFFIPKNTVHRIEAMDKDAIILEVSTGYFDEDDIERLQDDFGRVQ